MFYTGGFIPRSVVQRPIESLAKSEQLAVTFVAGYTAGIFCAIASHPSDTMISKLQRPGATMSNVYEQIGFTGLWKGLGPRILMIGTIAASQWFIYDAVKVAFNVPRPPPPEKPASLSGKWEKPANYQILHNSYPIKSISHSNFT